MKYALAIILFVVVAGCASKPYENTREETVRCDGKCIVIFRPDDQTAMQMQKANANYDFAEVVADHMRYAEAYKNQTAGSSIGIKESTARFITVENGAFVKRFETVTEDYMFGVILSRPDAEPVVHYGVFTDVEYEIFARRYFK